jgi:putative restriction endonuclease
MNTISMLSNFLSFKQGISRKLGKAPHKPILMLAVLEGISKGEIAEIKVFITPELVSDFRSYWNALVDTGHTPNFALPFFHLKNENSGVWSLVSAPGFENAITSSNSIKSLKALQDYVYYAKLNDVFFVAMTNPEKRLEAKQFILHKYFNKSSVRLRYSLLNEAEKDVLGEDPESYTAKMKTLLNKPEEELEEEQFVRSHAFKKAIPKIYQNTCAISGLRVDATVNVSMIDACHIVPFAESHNDHATNGIALSPNLHRAFDRGLISIDEDYRVLVSDQFVESDSNYSIRQFEAKPILLPELQKYHPGQYFLHEHRQKFGFS